MNKDEIKKILVENSAYLSMGEGELLFKLAQARQGNIVEIGSFLGGSTITLAKGLKDPYKVYAVDPHVWIDALVRRGEKLVTIPRGAKQIFKKNIKKWGVGGKIIPIEEISEKAARSWKGKIEFLWIDGDHEYNSVKKDFLLWEPFLKKGGVIAFHDSVYNEEIEKEIIPFAGVHHLFFKGPQRVVKEYLYNSKRFKEIKSVDTITYAVKDKNAGFAERLKNKIAVYKINNPNGPIFLIKAKALIPFLRGKVSALSIKYIKNLFKKLFFLVKSALLKIDRLIGFFGIFLKKKSPKAYYFLRGIKNSIFQETIYIFFHIPKCAGSTFKKALYENLKENEFLTIYKPNFYLNSLSEFEKEKIKIILGHNIYYGIHKFFRQRPRYITFIRNPIDRIVSHYNYAVTEFEINKNKGIFPSVVSDKNQVIPFKEWVTGNSTLHNFISQMLNNFFYYKAPKEKFDCGDFKKMKEILKKFYFIGISENYDSDSLYLYKKLTISKFPKKQNVSKKYLNPNDKNLREWISQYVQLDLKIYQYAISLNNRKKCNVFFRIFKK